MADSRTASPKPQRRTGVREAAAQATRDSILKAATKVFAKYGYDGGSVEKISKAAKSYDRMIYYYFGSKEGCSSRCSKASTSAWTTPRPPLHSTPRVRSTRSPK